MATGLVKAVSDALAPIFRPAGTLIPGIQPGSWASPQNPIRPTIQLGVGIRGWDFTPGINLQFTPRGDVPISFQQLWAVSNSFDLCRLAIETRKDQLVGRSWVVRVKALSGETKAAQAKRQSSNKNVTLVTNFLKRPDGVHTFDIWLRMWLEQLLVFDAPCFYPVKSMTGECLAWRLVSGATITPLLDQLGFTPQPPYPAYQQIILGIPTSNLATSATSKPKEYTVDELVYSPRNPRVDSRWGFSPVEQVITTLSIGANFQQSARLAYTSGNVPEGFLPMPEGWTERQIKDFQKWIDSMLAGNLAMKRRLIMVPDAKHPVQFSKDTLIVNPVVNEYLIRTVCYAFSLSPQNLLKQVNRGTAKESSDIAQIEGEEPWSRHAEIVINSAIESTHGITDVEFAFQDIREMDPLKQAQTDQIYLETAAYTINEVREARGDDPRPEPQANMLGLKTATGWVGIGETAAQPSEDDDQPPTPGRATPVKVRKITSLKLRAGDLTPRSRQARNDLARQLTKLLGSQRDRIASQASQAFAKKTSSKASKVPRGTLLKDADDDARAILILNALNWDYNSIYTAAEPYLEIAAEEGAHAGAYQTASNLGASLQTTLEDATPKAKAAADARAAELVGLEIQDDGTLAEATAPQWAISTTAKDDVLAAIKQAIVENWTPQQLEAVIQASVVWTPDHAELIADNEISRQQSGGHLISWRASGKVLEYQWTVQDLGCCPLCAEFAALGPVPVGYEFAPMITAPGAHPLCRCWLTATKVEGEE
jgi:hypothetical protein